MRKVHTGAAAVALIAMPSLAQAQATASCMTRAEANALFVSTLPDLLEGVRDKCSATLPPAAFLNAQGPALVGRYRASVGGGNWALAKSGFIKMTGEKGSKDVALIAALPDEALRGLLGTAFAMEVAGDIKVKDCPNIDRFVAALSPLPPSNVAEIITGLIAMAGNGKDDPFRLCAEG
jgi:hypothetical protein